MPDFGHETPGYARSNLVSTVPSLGSAQFWPPRARFGPNGAAAYSSKSFAQTFPHVETLTLCPILSKRHSLIPDFVHRPSWYSFFLAERNDT